MTAFPTDPEHNLGCVLEAFAEQGPDVSLDECVALVVNGQLPAPSGG